ncbi:carboxypeptidase-like regulatory domain-containing protein [Paraliomyxa miuraensis]|uniref:carboxypeptidase-like regulatory domain-containing protein n=1 Tax=Paraliomyxa miuraensis TaxID=376150 RepID=UPI002258857B|nr:carboxypeptidase-like regulatory domain-containing protein [Paraliomyxa miuraensis]MCX4239418.1 carboxypeptidase-like regulatory domain-containing protein [Paraliomyxa miuraensis]
MAEVRGRVLDTRNQPVVGATIRVLDQDNGNQREIKRGTTNSSGYFSVPLPSSWKDADANIFGGGNPDIHVTVEVESHYSTGNFGQPNPANKDFKTTVTSDAVGKTTKIYDWPGFKKNLPDHDIRKSIDTGTLKVPEDKWETVRTSFDVAVHGFPFRNTKFRGLCVATGCKGDLLKKLNSTQALCGGMSLSALERYMSGRCDAHEEAIPKSNELPPALEKEILGNQLETFFLWRYDPGPSQIGKYDSILPGALSMSTPAWRFFEWQAKTDEPNKQFGNTIGASTKEEWPKIRDALKSRKIPVVLGLIKTTTLNFDVRDWSAISNNHQVLAIGYDYNPRYQTGTIYLYEPNKPGSVVELRFKDKLVKSKMYIDYSHGSKPRGFFLNTQAPQGLKPPTSCGATSSGSSAPPSATPSAPSPPTPGRWAIPPALLDILVL